MTLRARESFQKKSVAQGYRVVCGRPAAFSRYGWKAAGPRQNQAWPCATNNSCRFGSN